VPARRSLSYLVEVLGVERLHRSMNRKFFSFFFIVCASFAAWQVGGERNAVPKKEIESSVEPHNDHEAVTKKEAEVEPHNDHEAVTQKEAEVEAHNGHEAVTQKEAEVAAHNDHEAVAQKEAELEPHYDHDAVTQKEADASEAGLGVLREFFKPESGEMAQLLVGLEETNKASTKAAKRWTQKSYEAMKGAHRVLVQSTNRAQNVLMHDGLRVNAAVKGQFHNEMAMLDPLSLDPKLRQRIRQEHGEKKLLPIMPENLENPNELKGIKVLTNSRYHGEDAHLVRGQHGKIDQYLPGKAKWRISLESDKKLKPELDITEFEMLPHDDVKLLQPQKKEEEALLGTHGAPSGQELAKLQKKEEELPGTQGTGNV